MASGLPILGTILVFAAVLVPTIALNLQLQIAVVLLGLLIIEAGVWQLAPKLLPNERKYLSLRAEVEGFISRIRLLNTQAVNLRTEGNDATREAFRETLEALHAAVDRMAEVAGREG